MAVVYTLDTTPSAPAGGVPLQDIGIRVNVPKPSTGYNLSSVGISQVEIQNSGNLTTALANGWIILYADGVSVSNNSVTPSSNIPTFLGDTGSGGVSGLVPAPLTGDAAKYLKGDGTWSTVSASGSTLQATYNASTSPEILTDAIRGALTIRRGSAADTNNVLEIQNGAGTITASLTGAGVITGSNLSGTNTGDQTITLTGDVTGSGSGSFATTIATVTAAKGGTGQTTYAVGDILYASAATTLSKLPSVITGNALISGGVTTAPLWGKIGLTTHVSGILPVVNGGTGASTALGSFNAISPLTTKGDLIGRDSTNNIRIPVGINNQYLIADSSQASGLLWAGIDRDFQTVSTLDSTSTQTAPTTTTFYVCPGSLSLTTIGRAAKAYQISFTGMFSINSSVDRLTTFRFIVDGVAQTAYDTQVFTTDNNRQTQISRIFTLPSIAPSVVISMQYSVNTTNSTVLRLFSANLSIVGVG